MSPLCLCWCRANTSLFLVFNHAAVLLVNKLVLQLGSLFGFMYMYADSHLETRIFVFMASCEIWDTLSGATQRKTPIYLTSFDGRSTIDIKHQTIQNPLYVVDDDYWTMLSSTMMLLLHFLRPISDFTCTQEDKLRGDKCSTSSRGSPLSNVLI